MLIKLKSTMSTSLRPPSKFIIKLANLEQDCMTTLKK